MRSVQKSAVQSERWRVSEKLALKMKSKKWVVKSEKCEWTERSEWWELWNEEWEKTETRVKKLGMRSEKWGVRNEEWGIKSGWEVSRIEGCWLMKSEQRGLHSSVRNRFFTSEVTNIICNLIHITSINTGCPQYIMKIRMSTTHCGVPNSENWCFRNQIFHQSYQFGWEIRPGNTSEIPLDIHSEISLGIRLENLLEIPIRNLSKILSKQYFSKTTFRKFVVVLGQKFPKRFYQKIFHGFIRKFPSGIWSEIPPIPQISQRILS